MKKLRSHALVAVVAALIAIQFAPVQKSNPRGGREIHWDSPETAELARRACYDCHSNETVWPWYANVAPVSWRVSKHVNSGRSHLNFSNWTQPNEDLDEIKEQLEEGEMPLWDYLILHSEARLTEAETQRLVEGLAASYENDPPVPRRRPGGPPADERPADSTTTTATSTTPADSVASSDSTASSTH